MCSNFWEASICFWCFYFLFENGSMPLNEYPVVQISSKTKQKQKERKKNGAQHKDSRPSNQMSCSTNVKIEPMNMWTMYAMPKTFLHRIFHRTSHFCLCNTRWKFTCFFFVCFFSLFIFVFYSVVVCVLLREYIEPFNISHFFCYHRSPPSSFECPIRFGCCFPLELFVFTGIFFGGVLGCPAIPLATQ